jgi:class 3 adenylate cyclase
MARRIVEGGYQTTLWARRPESLEPFAETARLIRDDAAAAEDFPRLGVGLALGHAISRAGDWFGSPVNLASRVTGAAPASTVRVTEAARKAIGDPVDIEWSAPEAWHLKGIRGEFLLHGARRLTAGESHGSHRPGGTA